MPDISFQRIDSRSELLERLRKTQRSVLLGGADEACREFFIAEVAEGAIGVSSQGHGIKPRSLVDESCGEVWIGYNSRIANVDLCLVSTRFDLGLDSVFYAIVAPMHDGSVIIVHELGACRVTRSGKFVWKRATDMVTDFSEDGGTLRLLTGEEELRIDKESGGEL
jgi:hypothetical protein